MYSTAQMQGIYNGNAFVTRLNAVMNAFTRGQVGVYTMRQTSLHVVTNAFTHGGKQAYTRLRRGSERDCTWLQTRSRYILHLSGTVEAGGPLGSRVNIWSDETS